MAGSSARCSRNGPRIPGEARSSPDGDDRRNDTHYDAVFWGAIVSVMIAVVMVVFLGFKVRNLMKQDARSHKNQ